MIKPKQKSSWKSWGSLGPCGQCLGGVHREPHRSLSWNTVWLLWESSVPCYVPGCPPPLLGQLENTWGPQNIDPPNGGSCLPFLMAEEWVRLFPSWGLTKIKRCRTLVGSWNWNHASQRAKWKLWSAGFSGYFCHSALRPTLHLHTNHSRWDFKSVTPWGIFCLVATNS